MANGDRLPGVEIVWSRGVELHEADADTILFLVEVRTGSYSCSDEATGEVVEGLVELRGTGNWATSIHGFHVCGDAGVGLELLVACWAFDDLDDVLFGDVLGAVVWVLEDHPVTYC